MAKCFLAAKSMSDQIGARVIWLLQRSPLMSGFFSRSTPLAAGRDTLGWLWHQHTQQEGARSRLGVRGACPQPAIRGNHFATTNSIRSGNKVCLGPPATRQSKTTPAFSFTRSLLFSGVRRGMKGPAERVRGRIVSPALRYAICQLRN